METSASPATASRSFLSSGFCTCRGRMHVLARRVAAGMLAGCLVRRVTRQRCGVSCHVVCRWGLGLGCSMLASAGQRERRWPPHEEALHRRGWAADAKRPRTGRRRHGSAKIPRCSRSEQATGAAHWCRRTTGLPRCRRGREGRRERARKAEHAPTTVGKMWSPDAAAAGRGPADNGSGSGRLGSKRRWTGSRTTRRAERLPRQAESERQSPRHGAFLSGRAWRAGLSDSLDRSLPYMPPAHATGGRCLRFRAGTRDRRPGTASTDWLAWPRGRHDPPHVHRMSRVWGRSFVDG